MKMKSKKKLTFRRFAYYLLIVSILVSCVTNGIFAKFTTEDSGGDGARVAKFGIKLSVAGDMFSTTYNMQTAQDLVDSESVVVLEAEDSNLPAAWVATTSDEDVISVQANYRYVLADGTESETSAEGASFNNVVAPGTKNDTGICIDIQGTAETDCGILYDISYKPVYLNIYNSYGLMVEINKEVINEANWEEMVASGLYYVSKTVYKDAEKTEVDYNEYTAVKTTDTYEALYNSTPKFFKMTNVVENTNDEISDGDCYYPTTLKVKKVENGTETEFSSKDLTPAEFFAKMSYIGSLMGDGENFFNVEYPSSSNASKATLKSDPSFPDFIETNTSINKQFYFTWEWDFEDENDAYDTILGYIAAGEEVVKFSGDVYTTDLVTGIEDGNSDDYNLNFEVSANVTINQVD